MKMALMDGSNSPSDQRSTHGPPHPSTDAERQARAPLLLHGPVFSDPGHRRARLLKWVLVAAILFAGAWFAGFAASIYRVEKLPGAALLTRPDDATDRLFQEAPIGAPIPAATEAPYAAVRNAPLCDLGAADTPPELRRHGLHLASGRDWSGDLLGQDCGVIGTIYADMMRVDAATGFIRTLEPELANADRLRERLGEAGGAMRIFPVAYLDMPATVPPVSSADGAAPAPRAAILLEDPAARAILAQALADFATGEGHSGLCLEASGVADVWADGLRALLADLGARLAPAGAETCLIVPATSRIWRDPAVVVASARVVIQMFQTGSEGIGPSALAPQDWIDRTLADIAALPEAGKVVLALGNFGQLWKPGAPAPERIGFAEAHVMAADSGGSAAFGGQALNTLVTHAEVNSGPSRVWLLDAASFHNQMVRAKGLGLRSVALWSAGTEDPGVWPVLWADATGKAVTGSDLAAVPMDHRVVYRGEGPVLSLADTPATGQRQITLDAATGLITGQRWLAPPRPYIMDRSARRSENLVVLTFDDGPDAEQTPAILDILQDKAAPAVFFTLGQNVLKAPDVARRIVADGHEIGSHTFFHPNTDAISETRLTAELNALQRLLRAVTGQGTVLFRTPYGWGTGPASGREARPLALIDGLGYLTIGSDVVPPDWERATVDDLLYHTFAGLEGGGSRVIVLHDAGGDRSATIAALPQMIDALREAGYRIVSLSELLEIPREALMPPATGPAIWFDRASFAALSLWGRGLAWVFWAVILFGLARSLAVLVLALSRRHFRRPAEPFLPPVTVLVPAYNEEAGIVASTRTVLASDYPDLRVIVVDDGSRDHTFDLLQAEFGQDPRVRIIRERNAGKWMALDRAYAALETDFVVAMDADTVIAPDAVRLLMQAFADPQVGAVAGMVRVGNRGRMLTRLQALEYVTAQNIDRRAAERLGAMLVVPGAIGAWRAEAVRRAGLYTNDTLTEDADLTVAVQRAGYRVVFEEAAYSVTEAPETLPAFLRQRLRWTLGMMQTGWKHRAARREGRAVGWIAIPDLFLFGIGLGLLAPLADLVFLAALADLVISGGLDAWSEPEAGSWTVVMAYLALPAMDAVVAALAILWDRHERGWLLLLLPVQRLVYRPLLYITVWRAVIRALSGRLAEWGRQRRTGSARLPLGSEPAKEG